MMNQTKWSMSLKSRILKRERSMYVYGKDGLIRYFLVGDHKKRKKREQTELFLVLCLLSHQFYVLLHKIWSATVKTHQRTWLGKQTPNDRSKIMWLIVKLPTITISTSPFLRCSWCWGGICFLIYFETILLSDWHSKIPHCCGPTSFSHFLSTFEKMQPKCPGSGSSSTLLTKGSGEAALADKGRVGSTFWSGRGK